MKIANMVESGAYYLNMTEMLNAGKRGKKCRYISIGFTTCPSLKTGNEDQFRTELMAKCGLAINEYGRKSSTASFDEIAMMIKANAPKVGKYGLEIFEQEIRGIDAPVQPLTAGGRGWRASATEEGVTVEDLLDTNNYPMSITAHDQSKPESYRIAKKVWTWVERASSYSDAVRILRDSGIKIHSYCAMD